MRRLFPFALFVLAVAAALPAQAQLLKKLEETLKKAVPAAGDPEPAAAPKPAVASEDGELPPPAPGDAVPTAAKSGYLGVDGETDPAGGVRISGFKEIGNAKASGLKVKDRITAVNGAAVKDDDELAMLLEKTSPGDTATLTVVRDGEEHDIKVKLVQPPVATLGITVVTLNELLRERLGVPIRRGAVVTAVRPGSPAELAGVPVNSVVVKMDGQMIANSEALVTLIRAAKPGKEAELSYYVGDKLLRRSVELASVNINTLPLDDGDGGELKPGPVGAERPLLSRVEKIREGAAPALDLASIALDVAAILQSQDNMRAEMNLRIEQLEKRVKALEAMAAPQPAEPEAPKAKPTPPRSVPSKPETPKLKAPAKT